MNNIFRSGIIVILLSLALVTESSADSGAKFPTGNISYTIKITPRGADKTADKVARQADSQIAAVTEIRVVRMSDLVRYQLRWNNGDNSEVWGGVNSVLVVNQNHKNGDVFIARSEDVALPLFTMLDDRSIHWISDKNLVKQMFYGGKNCNFHCEEVWVSDGSDNGAGSRKAIYQAWIVAESGLPVGLDNGEVLFTFTFDEAPPTGPLTMPENVIKELDRYRQIMEKPKHL